MGILANYYAYTLEERTKFLNEPETYVPECIAECYIGGSYYPLHLILVNDAKEPIKDNIFSLGIAGWYEGYELEHHDYDICRWDAWGGDGFLSQANVKDVAQAFANVDFESKVYRTRAFTIDALIRHFNNLRDFYKVSADADCVVEVMFMF